MATKKRKRRKAPVLYRYSQQKKLAFIEAFKVGGIITDAAVAAKISRESHYQWLEKDPAYAAAFRHAEAHAFDSLVREARRQALDGINEPVIWQGKLCGTFLNMAGQPVPEGDPTAEVFSPLTVNKKNPIVLMFLMNRHDRLAAEKREGESRSDASNPQPSTIFNFIFGHETRTVNLGFPQEEQRRDIDGGAIRLVGDEGGSK